jgi:hypothetical protein
MNPTWKNRIVGTREMAPADLKANPLNWRTHPIGQAQGLQAILEQIGVVQGVILNRTTGRLIDGHLRVEEAIATGQPTIPVVEVELSEEEERLVLATFDPIGDMASVNEGALDGLLGQLPEVDGALASVLETLSGKDFEPEREWQDMPEFVQPASRAFRSIHVHFNSEEDVLEFAKRLVVHVTDKTRWLWFPPGSHEQDKTADLRVVSGEPEA